MEFKGTKGKWLITEKDSNGIIKSTDAINIQQNEHDFFDICAVWRDAGFNPEEPRANALLISKAPEMLQMLKRVKDWYDSDDIINDHLPIEEIKQLIKESTEI